MYIINKETYDKLVEIASEDENVDFEPWNANGEESYFMGGENARWHLANDIINNIREFE